MVSRVALFATGIPDLYDPSATHSHVSDATVRNGGRDARGRLMVSFGFDRRMKK